MTGTAAQELEVLVVVVVSDILGASTMTIVVVSSRSVSSLSGGSGGDLQKLIN